MARKVPPPTGNEKLDPKERSYRSALTAVYLGRLEAEGLTKAELARKLGRSPGHVSKFYQGVGDFGFYALHRHARAISDGFSLPAALVQIGMGPRSDAPLSSSEDAIGVDDRLSDSQRNMLLAALHSAYRDNEADARSMHRVVQRRDAIQDVGIPASVVAAWVRLTPEQQEAAADRMVDQAARNEEQPAAPSRRRKTTPRSEAD